MDYVRNVSKPPKQITTKGYHLNPVTIKEKCQNDFLSKINGSLDSIRSNSFRVKTCQLTRNSVQMLTQRLSFHEQVGELKNLSKQSDKENQSINTSYIIKPIKRQVVSRQSNTSLSSGQRKDKIELLDFKSRLIFPCPKITARCWSIFEVNSCKLIWGSKCHSQKEVASLTKIVTLMTALKLCDLMNIQATQTLTKVSNYACKLSGTSANLKAGQYVSLYDLYYGIMLPSGNDAALVIAECLGALYYLHSHSDTNGLVAQFINDKSKKDQLNQIQTSVNQPVSHFVTEMNRYTRELNVTNSFWANPHGLNNKYNKSSAYDMARLTCKAMGNPTFTQVVGTKNHTAIVSHPIGGLEELHWINTNKLLDEGWDGVKTGITPNAGPCLTACVTVKMSDSNDSIQLVVVVLNSLTQEHRWAECKSLVSWASRIFQ